MQQDPTYSAPKRGGGPTRHLRTPPSQQEMAARPTIISAQEQEKAFKSARRHSMRVKILKWSMPVLVLIGVTGFVAWVLDNQPEPAPIELAEKATAFEQDELVMANPKLNGFSKGRAYEVVAQEAVQQVATPHIINLRQLAARLNNEKDEWVTITALSGLFDQERESLQLTGNVDVQSSLGYGLRTDGAQVDMQRGYMHSTSPVTIASGDIRLSADELEVIDNGAQFRFSRQVKLRIDASLLSKGTNKQAKDAKPQAATQ
ncbi:MAG: LPS export ABC transporter periplasmic protein LptC [Cohaesibacter sp.]|nr:LPS export ABC transporter periplasmic protein LptC [Cohaesibacter sp.]MCV6602152.1 LPS export ABC transporter periplasmic protein LptC [Cohaesibacter sp.]